MPDEWLRKAEGENDGHPVPETLSEPDVPENGNEGSAARVVGEVKRTIFPKHDLD